jgi:alginate O-acetyltransferase complex protein AlgI
MVFSSITFLLFFLPVFLAVYYLLPLKFKNAWIVAASLLFYGWGAPVFIFSVVASCLIDHIAAAQFNKPLRKLSLWLGVGINIALLIYFKYADFFIENFNFIAHTLTGREIPLANIVLPVGISFITFQKISYLVDIYRGDSERQNSFIDYLLFVLLFPQLIAGPIVRYKDIAIQINERFTQITTSNAFSGLVQFIFGLSKKVLIANVLGAYADDVFNSQTDIMGYAASITGLLAYTLQIYFDFSGYSDMAIGLGRMMGFELPVNFNFPYSSRSITEFWKRWHMTLGNWMKDYLYIPLGGNRGGQTYRNLMIVFLFSGLWHGASWNFVLWGAFHGTFLVAERIGFENFLKRLPSVLRVLYTFTVVMAGWVLFRTENLSDAISFYGSLVTPGGDHPNAWTTVNSKVIVAGMIGLIFSVVGSGIQAHLMRFYHPEKEPLIFSIGTGILALILFIYCVAELLATDFNPFIYFRF